MKRLLVVVQDFNKFSSWVRAAEVDRAVAKCVSPYERIDKVRGYDPEDVAIVVVGDAGLDEKARRVLDIYKNSGARLFSGDQVQDIKNWLT